MYATSIQNLMHNISDGKAVLIQLAVWVGVVQAGPLLRDTLCGLLGTQPFGSQCGKVRKIIRLVFYSSPLILFPYSLFSYKLYTSLQSDDLLYELCRQTLRINQKTQ